LVPPPGKRLLRCTNSAFKDGWAFNDMVGPDRVRMPTRPGLIAASFVFCDME